MRHKVRINKKKATVTWDKIVEQAGASDAFARLVEDKLDPGILEYWMCSIANSSDKITSKRFLRRRMSSLARKARVLADEVERVLQSPTIPLVGWAPDIETLGIALLPKRLRLYACLLETSLRVHHRGNVSPRTEEISTFVSLGTPGKEEGAHC